MTLGEAIQYAEQHAPGLVPLLRELEIRRAGAEALNRLVELERRRRVFAESLKDSSLVTELTEKINGLRSKMRTLNDALRRLLDESPGPVERVSE